MKKIYLWSILILTTLTSWSTRVFAQEIPTDSCTINIGTGYYYSTNNGWNDSYLQILQQGNVIATVQHHQRTPKTYSVTVPANEKTDFKWISDNTPVSFFISSSTGELLYVFNNILQDGIFFSYYVCSAPRNVTEFAIIPDTYNPQGATLSWTNPTQTINNDLLQTIDSIVLLKNNTILTTLYNLTPGAITQYTDNSFHAGDYYTVITYNGPMESLPITSTEPACRYKLNMHTNYVSWFGALLRFSSKGHLLGDFSLTHYGNENTYIDLPNDWITIEHRGINGTFSLYDENDSLILSGPGGLPERFQWYNGCSLDIPDTATMLSHSVQGNVVNLVWTNPTVTVHGDTLTNLSRVEIHRNDLLIHTFTNVVPGGQLSFTDTTTADGTFLYEVQCFNEAGGGVPSVKNVVTGNNWVLYNGSINGHYVDTACSISISNDNSYTSGGITTLTVFQSDPTQMLKISGSSVLDDETKIRVYAGTPENGSILSPDTVMIITPYQTATFEIEIPIGSSSLFHYTVECVNNLYEQPDTTIAIVPDSNGIIYVTQEGAGLRNGSSWANATPWLNRAVAVADTMTIKPVVWVAQGTYYGTPQMINNEVLFAFVGRNGVNVYGGFAGNEPADYNLSLRNFEQNATILDGLLHHAVLYLSGNSEWNGFHIQRGTNGCIIKSGSWIRHCVISDCLNNGIFSVYSIQGYYSGNIDSCLITCNGGHGIDAYYMSITNSTISHNAGDGVRARGTMHHCIITNNGGNGFYCTLGSSVTDKMEQCLVANNDGKGIILGYNYIVSQSTIVNNIGDGILSSNRNCKIYNSIIWGNGGTSVNNPYYATEPYRLIHCAVEGDYLRSSDLNIPLVSPEDSIGHQPNFVNPTAGRGKEFSGGDWHLLPNSVCVNRGEALDNPSETDLEGNIRVQQGIPDVGAYESAYDITFSEGNILYVKPTGNGDGSSWDHALPDLNYALESAWMHDTETQIFVAKGTYMATSQPFYLKEGLCLMGGFTGNEPSDYDIHLRNTIANATVLDGQHQSRVLQQTFDFERPAMVDGFTLTNGQAEDGAGAYLMANTTLSKCRVVNNLVTGDGAAVRAVRDTLLQVMVENNNGTGISVIETPLIHCISVRNSGDGVHITTENIQQHNEFLNSIFWGNANQNLHFTSAWAETSTDLRGSAVGEQWLGAEGAISLSSNNMDGAGPQFTSPTNTPGVVDTTGNWHLGQNSICVNCGVEVPAHYGIYTDMAGQPRMQGNHADAGAFETPYEGNVLYRTMEVFINEGESYTFYDTTLTTSGQYEHRWNVGDADSLVVLQLFTKGVVYVSEAGSGNKDGSSWANALDGQTATTEGSTKLADALAAAQIGTEFWIQSGTYYACSDSDVNKSLMLNEGVSLYGGFAGTETTITQRDTSNAPTVFSGNLQHDSINEHYSLCIFTTNEQNSPQKPILLDNITITEGYNNSHTGSALQIKPTSTIELNRCIVRHHFGGAIVNEGMFSGNYCALDSNDSYCDQWNSYIGAAALINKTIATANLNHCTIAYNQAPYDGALYNNGIMRIDSSLITRNSATTGHIGAIRNENTLTLTNSELSYNQSYKEFSTISSNGTLSMHNCVIRNNQSQRINPLYYFPQQTWAALNNSSHVMSNGVTDVSNCLFTHNSQNGGGGGGCLKLAGQANVRQCDFIDNIGCGTSASSYVPWGEEEEEKETPDGKIGIVPTYNTLGNDGGGIHVYGGNVYVEDCLFDHQLGTSGTSVSVRAGSLTMNRCKVTSNKSESTDGDDGVFSIDEGELIVKNSLIANNQNEIYNTTYTANSKTTFENCTFSNNQSGLCHFMPPRQPSGCQPNTDTSHVRFNNCIIVGNWNHSANAVNNGQCGILYVPNYTLIFTNTLFHHPDSTLASDCTPDSLGNIYYCDPMFVNPTSVMGVDSAQNPLLYDFRLQDGSPAINSGDTTGLHLTVDATDLDGEQRVKRCQIDRGCYEYGTIVYDTVRETLCVEQDALNQLSYNGYGFSIEQLEVGENTFTRTCDCHPDANDSVQTLQLNVSLIQYSEFDTVACDSFEWHDETFTASGIYTRTFSDAAGCDSIVTLHLTLNYAETAEFEETVCDSYTWNDQTYTASGDYTQTLTNASGCDSVVTLHLTVHEAVETVINDYLCNGSTYSFFEQELIYPGTYTHVGQTVFGCDSIVTLHLELKQTYTSFMNVTLCNGEGYEFFGETLYEAGTYTQTVPTEFGCDSTVILTVTTGATTYGELNASICDGSSYNFYGQQLTEAGDYTVTLTNSHGCDSILTLHLTVNHATHNVETETACDSYTWHGTEYTASGTYTYEYTNSNGCASVDTLLLTINFAQFAQFADTAYDSYTWNGQTYTASGDYTQTFTAANGCDSIVTLHLTLTVGIDDHNLGASMNLYPNPTTGVVNVECTMNNVQAKAVEFQLFDAFGRLIRITDGVETRRAASLQTDTDGSSVQTAQIDLSGFAAGVYFVKAVADGNVVAVRKVVKR